MSHWVIQSNFADENGWDVMINTFHRFNIPYSEHKVIPFVGELLPDINIPDKNVICMGSYSMRHIAKQKGWKPGVYDLFDMNFNKQMKHWGRHMLNEGSQITKEQKHHKETKPQIRNKQSSQMKVDLPDSFCY